MVCKNPIGELTSGVADACMKQPNLPECLEWYTFCGDRFNYNTDNDGTLVSVLASYGAMTKTFPEAEICYVTLPEGGVNKRCLVAEGKTFAGFFAERNPIKRQAAEQGPQKELSIDEITGVTDQPLVINEITWEDVIRPAAGEILGTYQDFLNMVISPPEELTTISDMDNEAYFQTPAVSPALSALVRMFVKNIGSKESYVIAGCEPSKDKCNLFLPRDEKLLGKLSYLLQFVGGKTDKRLKEVSVLKIAVDAELGSADKFSTGEQILVGALALMAAIGAVIGGRILVRGVIDPDGTLRAAKDIFSLARNNWRGLRRPRVRVEETWTPSGESPATKAARLEASGASGSDKVPAVRRVFGDRRHERPEDKGGKEAREDGVGRVRRGIMKEGKRFEKWRKR